MKPSYAQNQVQYSCGTPHPVHEGPQIPDTVLRPNRYPCGGDSIFYIRTVVHFFLKHDGTGNFNEFDDGKVGQPIPAGQPFNYHQIWNGYAFSAELLLSANTMLRLNNTFTYTTTSPCTLPTAYNPPPPPIKVQYILTGVYFHRLPQYLNYAVTNAWASKNLLNSTYAIDKYNTLNLVVGDYGSPGYNGVASGIPAPFGEMTASTTNNWRNYSASNHWENIIWSWWGFGSFVTHTLNHEVGHLLGLWHVYTSGTLGDYCADTPPNPPCYDGYTNNVMDSGLDKKVFTHEQRDRMYTCLTGDPLYQGSSYTSTAHIPSYKYECNVCSPAYSFSKVYEKCGRVYVGGGWYGIWNSATYYNQFIEIFETDANGSNTVVGNYYSVWNNLYLPTTHEAVRAAHMRDLSTVYTFAPNKWYKIKVAVQNVCTNWHESSNWIRYSGVVNLLLCGGSGSSGGERISSISNTPIQIYPNPNNGTFTLSIPQPLETPVQVRVTDISGKTQHQRTVTESITEWQLELPTGLYFILIPEKNFIQKIIINH